LVTGHRRDAPAQFFLGQRRIPHGIVIGEEEGALFSRAADHQRDVV